MSWLKDLFFPQGSTIELEQESSELSIERIRGFNEHEIIFDWLRHKLPNGYFILLKNIDLSFKSSDYWKKLTRSVISEMTKDYVILRCHSKDEMEGICGSIEPGFAECYGIKDGECVYG